MALVPLSSPCQSNPRPLVPWPSLPVPPKGRRSWPEADHFCRRTKGGRLALSAVRDVQDGWQTQKWPAAGPCPALCLLLIGEELGRRRMARSPMMLPEPSLAEIRRQMPGRSARPRCCAPPLLPTHFSLFAAAGHDTILIADEGQLCARDRLPFIGTSPRLSVSTHSTPRTRPPGPALQRRNVGSPLDPDYPITSSISDAAPRLCCS